MLIEFVCVSNGLCLLDGILWGEWGSLVIYDSVEWLLGNYWIKKISIDFVIMDMIIGDILIFVVMVYLLCVEL